MGDVDTDLCERTSRPPPPFLSRPPPCLSFALPGAAAFLCGVSGLVCMFVSVCELAAAGRLKIVSTLLGVAEGTTSSNTTADCPAGHTLLPVPDLM